MILSVHPLTPLHPPSPVQDVNTFGGIGKSHTPNGFLAASLYGCDIMLSHQAPTLDQMADASAERLREEAESNTGRRQAFQGKGNQSERAGSMTNRKEKALCGQRGGSGTTARNRVTMVCVVFGQCTSPTRWRLVIIRMLQDSDLGRLVDPVTRSAKREAGVRRALPGVDSRWPSQRASAEPDRLRRDRRSQAGRCQWASDR